MACTDGRALEAAPAAAAAENGGAPMEEAALAPEAEAAPDDGSWAEDAGGDDVAAKFKPGIKFKLAA